MIIYWLIVGLIVLVWIISSIWDFFSGDDNYKIDSNKYNDNHFLSSDRNEEDRDKLYEQGPWDL